MIRNSGWQRLQLGLVSALIVVFLQSCITQEHQLPQAQRSESVSSTCRVVRHELGESCIPQFPKHVVVMDQESLEILVALGLNPIATTIPNRVGTKTVILQEKTGELANLGREGEPELEKIVELKPDLIVGMFISPQIYDLLSQLAPTVSVEYSQAGWKQTFIQMADLLNRRPEANVLLADYQQRVKNLQAKFAQTIGHLNITVMRFYTDVHLTQFLNQNSFAGSIIEELEGVSLPDRQQQMQQLPYSDWGYINVSLEQLDLLEADAMFVVLDPGSERSFEYYEKSPLWQSLNVVQQNKIYFVDSGYWVFGNILAAHAVLDDLCRYLIREPCPS